MLGYSKVSDKISLTWFSTLLSSYNALTFSADSLLLLLPGKWVTSD